MPAARDWTEEEITSVLMALIAWAGNAAAASRYLEAEKGIRISPSTLRNWKTVHAARFDEMREKYAGEMESNLVHEYRDVARLAVEVERLAIDKAQQRLSSGEDQDPGRTAANLARVAQSSTDKLLSLSGRPTQITETRGVNEILRSLVSKGILELPAAVEGHGEPNGSTAA